MKKKTTIFILVFWVLSCNITAQQWVKSISGTNINLNDVYFLNPDTGFVCGLNGIILRSYDGGVSWNSLNSGVTDGLACIQFIDESVGYASGGFASGINMNCRLIKTINGGNTWSDIDVAPTKCGGGMIFITKDVGFYSYADNLYGNSVIAKTTDGGSSWNVVYSGLGWISYFDFVDSDHGYATVNNGIILKTIDGGSSWVPISLPNATLWGSGISFFDENTGIVGGGPPGNLPSMFKTQNGGLTWNAISAPDMIFKIFFTDNNIGYALTVNTQGAGNIIKSIDAGNNWSNEATPENNLRGLYFLNPNLGFAVGDSGVILKYINTTGIINEEYGYVKATIYPNPVVDFITLHIESNALCEFTFKLFNSFGSLVKTETFKQNQQLIYLDNLNSGIYIMEISSKEWVENQKLIIQK